MQTMVSIEHRKLVDVTEKMCDEYCKWREQALSAEVLEKFCEECPMSNLVKEDE